MRYGIWKQNPNTDNAQVAMRPDDSLLLEKKKSEMRSIRLWRLGIRWLGKTDNGWRPCVQEIISSFKFAPSTE